MTKKNVLRELLRVVDGQTQKTSEIVREFKKCPHFQQSCQILARALQHNSYGRKRSGMRVPAGLAPPG